MRESETFQCDPVTIYSVQHDPHSDLFMFDDVAEAYQQLQTTHVTSPFEIMGDVVIAGLKQGWAYLFSFWKKDKS